MSKPYTFPTLYDEVKQVRIAFLKKHGYLTPNQWQKGSIIWKTNGIKSGSISISVDTSIERPFLELDYKCNDAAIKYKVQLVTAPSNLGKGLIWYFICPHTGKRCRKLYLSDSYFYHRTAFRGCMYECQTQSKSYRSLGKRFGAIFKSEEMYKELYKKHFKKTYAGKPTKRYLKISKLIQEAKSIPIEEFEQAMVL